MPHTSSYDSEPRIEEIRELYDHVQRDPGIARQRALDRLIEDLYFGEHAILVEDTEAKGRKRKVRVQRAQTHEAARIVNLFRSFYTDPPRWGARFTGAGTGAQVEGENVGLAFNEAFDQLNTPPNSPWEDGNYDLILFGRRADLILSGEHYWWDFPWRDQDENERSWNKRAAEWRRKAPLPVTWINLSAKDTFPASLSTADDAAICIKRMLWPELIDVFGEDTLRKADVPVPESAKDRYREVTVGIYSNRSYIVYAFLGEDPSASSGRLRSALGGVFGSAHHDRIIQSYAHGLNRSAIRILPGMTTGRREFGYWWQSAIFHVRDMIVSADRLKSQAATSAQYDVNPILKRWLNTRHETGEEGSTGEVRREFEGDVIDLDPGDVLTGTGREDIQPLIQPAHAQQTRELLLFELQAMRQLTGAVEALEGQIQHAGTPAWALNWQGEQAQRKLAPLTRSIMAAGRDIAETIGAAVVTFGEPLVLAKLDEEGEVSGSLSVKPASFEKFGPVITGSYDAKVPQNKRADASLMMDMLAQAKQIGFPSPEWIAEQFGGIEDFYHHWGKAQTAWYVMSDEFKQAQARWIAQQLELGGTEDEGMGLAELQGLQGKLDPRVFAALMEQARRSAGTAPGAQPGGNGVTPETAGALRAGAPFSAAAGGPSPLSQTITEVR